MPLVVYFPMILTEVMLRSTQLCRKKFSNIVHRMTIMGDATTWSITSDDSRGVTNDCVLFTIQATGLKE